MKRMIFLFFALNGIVLFLTGSSPWEGAAAVAPAGELPETGFFVSTNSFPRNTVVDITNLETGRTTRAIVANTLNNSGLLAIVSREAAEIIGMRSGSVSRVRMIQPSDPMAYQQFTERLASGVPMVNDPVVEQRMLEELYSSDKYVPPVIPSTSPSLSTQPVSPPVDLTAAGFERGYVIDEPEWGGNGRLNIVEVPGFIVEPLEPFVQTVEQYIPPAEIYVEPATVPQAIARIEEPVITPVESAETIVDPPFIAKVEEPRDASLEMSKLLPEDLTNEKPVSEPAKYVDTFDPVSAERVVSVIPPVSVETIVSGREKETPVTLAEYTPEEPAGEIIKDISPRIEEYPSFEIVKDIPVYTPETKPEEIRKEIPVFFASEDSSEEIYKETPVFITEHQIGEIIKETPEHITEYQLAEVNKETPEHITEYQLAEVNKETPEHITEPVLIEIAKDKSDWLEEPVVTLAQKEALPEEPPVIAQIPEEPEKVTPVTEEPPAIAQVPEKPPVIIQRPEEPPATTPVVVEPVEIVSVPASELPQPFVPVESTPRVLEPTVYDIPLSDIIPGIVSTPSSQPAPREVITGVPLISESDIIPSIVQAQPAVSAPSAVIQPSSIIPSVVVTAPPVTSSSVVISPPVIVAPPASVSHAQSFSVRTISQLDRGQYYVQLAALPYNQVENTIRQIDQRYNPVVFPDRDNLYRVLIGPLNQGESAAILQRFKSFGFTDAFVRFGN